MITIPGYVIKKRVLEDSKVILYEGVIERNNIPVYIKTLKSNNPNPEDINKLRDIFIVNSRLNDNDGILKTIDFSQNNIYAYIFEYFRGKYLKEIINSGLHLNLFFKIAIRITEILSSIHEKKIIQ